MLLDAIKKQVEEWLESSLNNRVYIIPEQDKNPSQVQPHRNIEVKSGSKPKSRLPQNTPIIKVFDQPWVGGRLLILGQPGAGKTTMLNELAQTLMERAGNDLNEPIPVLFSLSAWRDDHQSIKDWIVAELNNPRKYQKNSHPDIIKWLEDGEIIPLLDGLDELAGERQESCVQKINEFLQPGNWSYPLVVCSRIQEYQLYPTQLALNTSLELQPFNDEQIQEYLRQTGNKQLEDNIRDDLALRELAQTPLLLNIIVRSCQNPSVDKWQELKSSEERRDYLFSTYIEAMLERKYEGNRPSHEKTKYWLGWLAEKLIEQNKTEFFIEKMQPACLENSRQERIYRLSVRLIGGLIVMLIIVLTVSLIDRLIYDPIQSLVYGLIEGLIGGLVYGLMRGLIVRLSGVIKTSEILQFNWKNLWRKELIVRLSKGLVVGLIGGLIFGVTLNPFIGLSVGLSVGLMEGLMGGFESSEIETKISPNQGIWKSLQNAVIFGLIYGLMGGLIFGLMGWRIFGLKGWLNVGLSVGLTVGLMGGLLNGGEACIQHFSLRLILYHQGHIPWNYARFLDYATERLFLQRVGGGYRFMHDLLRQHFAANYSVISDEAG